MRALRVKSYGSSAEDMTRTTERWLWIGVVLLLLVIGAILLLGPAGRMMAACDDMMQGGLSHENDAQTGRPRSGS